MPFESDLHFLREIFKKCNLKAVLIDSRHPEEQMDLGEFVRPNMREDSFLARQMLYGMLRPRTVYKLTDPFLCSYVFLELPPQGTERRVLVVGPYLSVEMSHKQLLEQAERAGIPSHRFPQVERFYGSLPVITQTTTVFAPIEAFCERMWGEDYAVVDINREVSYSEVILADTPESSQSPVELQKAMKDMETRYAMENEILHAVTKGQHHKLERLASSLSQLSFERRLADPIRNLKNYMIIMNTLLRKAAEQGGVHPFYIDKMSSGFAVRIEGVTSTDGVRELMHEMFRGYCRLVRKHSTGSYSAPVQKAVVHIEADLSADLSLQKLADMQNINASYLSALFKKETGENITDFIRGKRMSQAAHLLSTTKLQVQTIAQHCGIPDVNYFSKVFKNHSGKTPKEFRADVLRSIAGKK